MAANDREDELLRSVALKNAQSILEARQRVVDELRAAKQELEHKTEELAHSLAMVSATLESSTDGILVTEGSGLVTGLNHRFAELWQLPRELAAARTHGEILDFTSCRFADPASFRARIEEIYASSPPETYDLLETRDGAVIERFSQLQSIEGRDVGRVWSFRDITEHRRSEQALRDETQILELLNRTGAKISSQLDLQTLIQSVTEAGTQFSGAKFGAFFYNVTNDQGESFLLYTLSGAPREAFERFGLPRNTPLFARTFRGEGVARSADVTQEPLYGRMAPHHGMPSGHLPVRSYLAVPVTSRSGTVIGGLFFGHPEVGVFTERTERLLVGLASQAAIAIDNAQLYEDVKRLATERETLLEAERAARAEAQRVSFLKDEFLANVSHELRTPLNAILGWSQVIATGEPTRELLHQGLETIARNARAQAQLIEDLLDMNRIVSGKVRLEVQETDLAFVIQQAVNTVRPTADAKGVRLRAILEPVIGCVVGDPTRLQQVVWNLLSNAVKFTPKGGSVDVLLQRVNSQFEITVRDTGSGIHRDFLPHVFERFRQADSSTTRAHGGLGLGLAIVKQLVELHGGTVHVDSAGENKGTTFVVGLPLAPLRTASRYPDSTVQGSAVLDFEEVDLAGVRVLVVEDEADARQLIESVLTQCHAEVLTSGSVSEALELVRTQKLHVLISDIGMPEIDGYQFIRQVRGLPAAEGGTVPAIALTAFARSEDRARAMMAGFQMHIAKPVEPRELIATIANFAGRTTTGGTQ